MLSQFSVTSCCFPQYNCSPRLEFHVRFAGPALSGKSSIINWLKFADSKVTSLSAPTKGLEIDECYFGGVRLITYDSHSHTNLEGPSKIASELDNRGFEVREQPDGLVFVIDGADSRRLSVASDTLSSILDCYRSVQCVLVIATKSDLTYERRQTGQLKVSLEDSGVTGIASSGDSNPLALTYLSDKSILNGAPHSDGGDTTTTPGGGGQQPQATSSSGITSFLTNIGQKASTLVTSSFKAPPTTTTPPPSYDVSENPLSLTLAGGGIAVVGNISTTSPMGSVRMMDEDPRNSDKQLAPVPTVPRLTHTQVTAAFARTGLLQRDWQLFYCSSMNGEGIEPAINWLVNKMVMAKSPSVGWFRAI